VRRHVLGLIALASLIISAVICFFPPFAQYQAAGAIGLKVGLMLGVFWLAWPDLYRLPRWAWYGIPLGVVALYFARSMLIYLAPLLAAAIAAYVFYRRFWRAPR
jgi:hypothetical protein